MSAEGFPSLSTAKNVRLEPAEPREQSLRGRLPRSADPAPNHPCVRDFYRDQGMDTRKLNRTEECLASAWAIPARRLIHWPGRAWMIYGAVKVRKANIRMTPVHREAVTPAPYSAFSSQSIGSLASSWAYAPTTHTLFRRVAPLPTQVRQPLPPPQWQTALSAPRPQ